ncbi:MAG: hypothetical protein OCD00_03085 [Colwellia sp.]
MAFTKIAANSQKRIPTTSKYLTIIKSSGALHVFNEDAGIKEFQIKQNNIVEMDGVGFLYFVNKSNVELEVEYQSTSLKVHSGDSGTVEITGSVVVDRIENGIEVATSVGSVEILPANSFTENEDVTVAANTKVLLLSADLKRKECEIFIHGADYCLCRVGSTNITNTKGRVAAGGGGVIGSIAIKGTDALYFRNTDADNSVIVSLGAESRV